MFPPNYSIIHKAFKKDIKTIKSLPIQQVNTSNYSKHIACDSLTIRGRDQSFAYVSFSTYPIINGNKQGEPNCDRVGCMRFNNASVSVVADGCGWGPNPCMAADLAISTSFDYILNKIGTCLTTYDIALMLVDTVVDVQNTIFNQSSRLFDSASCTILITVTITTTTNEICTIILSIGDCRAFLYEPQKCNTIPLNGKWHKNVLKTPSCGGRIGYEEPCLKGCELKLINTKEDDYIICTSDGFYDNFDCKICGVDIEQQFYLNDIMSSRLQQSANLLDFVERISDYLINSTQNLRNFHSCHRKVRQDGLVGKLDHSSLIIYQTTTHNFDVGLIDIISPNILNTLYPDNVSHQRIRSRSFDLRDIKKLESTQFCRTPTPSIFRLNSLTPTPQRIHSDVRSLCYSPPKITKKKSVSCDSRYSITPPLRYSPDSKNSNNSRHSPDSKSSKNSRYSPEFLACSNDIVCKRNSPSCFVNFFLDNADS
ncbi:PPM-type phosphatase domain-containing protein [Entamoeba marina]